MYAVPAAPCPPANDSASCDVEQVRDPDAACAWDVLVTVVVVAGAVCVTGAPVLVDDVLDCVVPELPHPAAASSDTAANSDTAAGATAPRLRASGVRTLPDTSSMICGG